MKTKLIIIIFLSIVINPSCDLTLEEFSKITPDTFYKNKEDAELAIAALYRMTHSMWNQSENATPIVGDHTTDISRGWSGWDNLFFHNWTADDGAYTGNQFVLYSNIANARIVGLEIEKMDISDDVKNPLLAECFALAGWLAQYLYDWYGPLPHPADGTLQEPLGQYPTRASFEEYVEIIEKLFQNKDLLMDPDWGGNFGRMNKAIANFILMRLYMHEAGRTGNSNFYSKAKSLAEEIINSGWYELQNDYSSIFSMSNRKNREIIYARPAEPNTPSTFSWHGSWLPNNFPCVQNRGVGTFGTYHLQWAWYDTFDMNDLRLNTIVAEYTTDEGRLINREDPYDDRHGVALGPVGLKYDLDPNPVGNNTHHDYIVYRYAEVMLTMAEILNELSTNASVNAPVIKQVSKNGNLLQSDGGSSAFSFINAVRVRAGINPLSNDLSKSQLRDAILMERGHELWGEGARRTDLIRYQRVTNSQGYKIYDQNLDKLLMPIPNEYITEYRGNLVQNPGY